MSLLALLLFTLFFTLAILHYYWAIGGKWGFDKALPTDENGKRILNPRPLESTLVGLLLTSFSVFYLYKSELIWIDLSSSILNYISWTIPFIFILRAVGDFKYIGFFKRVRSTVFAKLDTVFYSPLCLFIGLTGIIINLF